MKLLNNEKGYSLLLTLILVLLFSILGASLLAMTFNGTAKNETRENVVQAQDLAEKGIEHLSSQINAELTAKLGDHGLSRTEYLYYLENTLDDYLCTPSISIPNKIKESSTTGTYETCIESYTDAKDINGEINPLKQVVTFRSLGESNKAEKKLISDVEIGSGSAPEALKYAIGSNFMNPKKDRKSGEGNLIIHGGVDIQGDIKVDGDIVTYDRGYAYLGGERWIPSLRPSALKSANGTPARIVLGGNAFTLESNPSNYENHINNNYISDSSPYKKQLNIDKLFRDNFAPEVVVRQPQRESIGITSQKTNFEFYRTNPNVKILTTENDKKISNKNLPNSNEFLASKVCTKWGGRQNSVCEKYEYKPGSGESETFIFESNNSFKRVATKGNVSFNNTNTSFKEGLYVEGLLEIGNGNTSHNVNNYSDVTLDGPIYVNGEVKIKGADLYSNTLMYVDGNVTIEYSSINGKNLTGGKTGSLIVFATGDIRVRNNSVNLDHDLASKIKGFFYSEQNFEMFGVGSNIKIEGGISARRIVLNAIRGRAKDNSFTGAYPVTYPTGWFSYTTDYFEGLAIQTNPSTKSRLQVIYDLDIISTYSDLKQQEPIIVKVDPPVVTERKN